jgi:microcystin-dependent protein
LWRRVRDNFIAHESLLSDIEEAATFIPTGAVLKYAGETPPSGFLLCDGSLLLITDYANLYAICGTSFNQGGEPVGYFRLPDLRGRTSVGVGTGTGLTARALGASFGEESHVLTTAEIPSHTHTIVEAAHTHNIVHDSGVAGAVTAHEGNGVDLTAPNMTTNSTDPGITASNAGSGSGHNTMQPSLVLNFVIKA